MLRLRLLGSRELERTDEGDTNAVFAQPKRFALLAYLACRADRFHRRDTLLAVFWPELDTFAARRALRNALYQLRLALDEDVFVARGDDELMVDRTKLWCDVPALGDALTDARYEEAVALYRGELLEGGARQRRRRRVRELACAGARAGARASAARTRAAHSPARGIRPPRRGRAKCRARDAARALR